MENNEINTKDGYDNTRLDRLSRRGDSVTASLGYSIFVRIMRLALPFAAIVVIAVLFIRTGVDDNLIVPVEEEKSEIKERNIARNELLNPKFESMDKKNQPYVITADRAIQGKKNKDLIMLERPVGIMSMTSGTDVTMRSNTGAYRQDTERFFLQGKVLLEHQDGYILRSEEAHIDLNKSFAWSEKNVLGTGPDLIIDAKGVSANGKTGEIIFTGPVKLILENGFGGAEK